MDKQPEHSPLPHAFAKNLRQGKEEQRQREGETGAAPAAQLEESDSSPDQGKAGGKHADRPRPVIGTPGHGNSQGKGEESQRASFGEFTTCAVGAEKELAQAEKGGQQRAERGKGVHSDKSGALSGQPVGQQHAQADADGAAEEGNTVNFKLQQQPQRFNAVVFKVQLRHQQRIADPGQDRAEGGGKHKGEQGVRPGVLSQLRQPRCPGAAQTVQGKDCRGAGRHNPQIGAHSAFPPSQAEAK